MKRKDISAILDNTELDREGQVKALLDLYHSEIDEIRDANDALQEQIDSFKADIEKANQGKTDAENALEEFKAKLETDRVRGEKSTAYKSLLKEAGIADKRIDIVLKSTDIDSLEMTDGAFTDKEKLLSDIKKEWSDFIPSTEQSGANTNVPPANNPQTTYTRADIAKMSADEINKNWDAVKASLKNGG